MRTYMTITDIAGETFTLKSVEGAIDVLGMSNDMGYPFDKSLGEKTGQMIYHPFHIIKRVDKATPLLFQALQNNKNIAEVQILYYRETDAGATKWEHYFTMVLTDVRVISQNTHLKQQDQVSDTASLLETISIIGRTVAFTDPLNSIEHSANVRDDIA